MGRNAGARVGPERRKRLAAWTGSACWFCGVYLGRVWSIDHLTPRSRGGTNDCTNLVASCNPCNQQKKDRTLEEYRDWVTSLTGVPARFYGERMGLVLSESGPPYARPLRTSLAPLLPNLPGQALDSSEDVA